MNLKNLSLKELKELKNKTKKEIAFCNVQQYNRKILLNAFYGACANSYFRWFDLSIPKSITLTGQFYIKSISEDINNYLNKILKNEELKNYIVAGDTDSIYISFNDFIKNHEGKKSKKELAFLCNEIAGRIDKFIEKKFLEYGKERNVFDDIMSIKRENIIDKALWVAKKRYIAHVLLDEANVYDENRKYKIMGLELIKSSTPKALKPHLLNALPFILNNQREELIIHLKKIKKEFLNLTPEEIAFPRNVKKIYKWFNSNGSNFESCIKKGTPIHVRGSILYNLVLSEKKSNKEIIQDNTKIKFIYLKEPNPLRSYVISFPNEFPKDIIPLKFVDYQKQFQKTFLDVIEILIKPLNWNLRSKKSTLVES